MNKRLSNCTSCYQRTISWSILSPILSRHLHASKNNICLYRAPTVIQAPSFDPLSAKSFQTLQERSSTHIASQEHTPPASSQLHENMASIDAIVNAGPSAQQIDDEPVEKFDALNIREDSEGWNDVEEDNEEFNVQCLFCSELSTSLAQSLEHMKAQHEFDLVAFRTRHGG